MDGAGVGAAGGGTDIRPYVEGAGVADTEGTYMEFCETLKDDGVGVLIGTKPDEDVGKLCRGPRACGGCVEYTDDALDTGSYGA